MPGHDDLDEHFRSHPRLRKYSEMFDRQKQRAVVGQQRVAWLGLALVAAMVWYWMFRHSGNWNPLSW